MSVAQKYRAVLPYFICVCSWKHAFYCVFKEQMSGQCLKHITRILKNVFSTLKEKKESTIMNSVCQFVFSRNILTVEGLSTPHPLNVPFRCQGRPKPSWASRLFYWLSRTATYKPVSQGLRVFRTSGVCVPFLFIERNNAWRKSNRSTYFEDLGEGEPEASECSGEIGWRVSEGWKTAEGRGCAISLGDTVGGLAGTAGVVGGTDGPGSGSKFYSV